MSSYIIAGSSDNLDTSECENLANNIRQYYKDISFKIVLKDPSEWEQYIDEVCRIYGFKTKSNPIVYTMDGKLIGGRIAFVSLAETRFGIANPKLRQGPITPDINKKSAKQDLDVKTKEQRKKLTLLEKIENQTLEILIKKTIKPIQGTYERQFTNGMNFYVKFEERLCPPYNLQKDFRRDDLQELVEEQDTVLVDFINEDGVVQTKKIPMFCDRFTTIEHQQFLLQLQLQQQELQSNYASNDKQMSSTRGQIQMNTSNKIESPVSKPYDSVNKQAEIDQLDQDQLNINDKEQQNHQEQEIGTVEENNLEELRPETAPILIDTAKDTLPETFQINHLVVHQFKNGNVLILHPDPLIEGQGILINPLKKPGQLPEDPSDLFLEDYSKVQRGRYNSYKAMLKTHQNLDKPKLEGLYQPQIDVYSCISLSDSETIVKLIQKVDAICTINVLPQNETSFLPLSNGHINVLLRKFAILQSRNEHLLPYLSDLKGNKKKQILPEQKLLLPLEEFIIGQKSKCYVISKNVYQMKGFDIQHYLAFPEKMMTGEQTLDNINQLFNTYLEKEPNAPLSMGFSLIISKYIILLYPTYKNHDTINEVNVHLPIFGSLGFLNLPLDKNISESLSTVNYFQLLKRTQQK